MIQEDLMVILPEQSPYSKIICPPLGQRVPKPRNRGITMVIDKGLGKNSFIDLMETAGQYVDILKFGFGSCLLYPENVLRHKLMSARLHSVITCTGGTFSEIALHQNQFESMVEKSLELGFAAIEISDGTMTLDRATREAAIRRVSKEGIAISEVGKKLDAFPPAADIVAQIDADLNAGAQFVIMEGRESGENVGIYKDRGTLDEQLLDELVKRLSQDSLKRIIWEAPKKAQQTALIQRFGTNVNLGNVAPDEALAVECLRQGLRSDTFVAALLRKK